MRVAFQSVRGAPGVSTLALATAVEAAAHRSAVLLVEADESGGVLSAELGLPPAPTVVEFGTDARMTAPEIFLAEGVHFLGNGLSALTSPCSPRQSASAWSMGAAAFGELAARLDGDLVIDLGRGSTAGAPAALERLVDRLAFVVRPALPDLAGLVATLREHDSEPSTRLIAVVDAATRSKVNPREVRHVLAPHGQVVEVPWDPAAIDALHADPFRRRWTKSRFGSAVAGLVTRLLADCTSDHSDRASVPSDVVDLTAVAP